MVMAVVLLFGGVFSFFGMNGIGAKALVDGGYDRNDIIYYFSDYYPTISHTTFSQAVGKNCLVYDVQKVDEEEFGDMVSDDYFSGFGYNCMFILDIKTFAPGTDLLYELFSYLKDVEECKTVLITNSVSSAGLVYNTISEYVDIHYNCTDDRLGAFAEAIVTRQMEEFADKYLTITGNGTLNNTTFLIDNILDDLTECVGNGLDYLREVSPFFNRFIPALLEYAMPDPDLVTVSNEDILTNSNIRILVHTGECTFVDVITGEDNIALPNNDGLYPTALQDYAVVGFSNLDKDLWNMLKAFREYVVDEDDSLSAFEAEYLLPIHLLEAEPIIWDEDGLVVSAFFGDDENPDDLLTALVALYESAA